MPIGALISGAASLIGGALQNKAAKKANQAAEAHALRQEQLQREFAQNGIRWRVEDAKAAGLHPLMAVGAPTANYSPVSVGHIAENGMSSALASMGQDIGRAVNATRTGRERDVAFDETVRGLTLQKMGLENELLASQIAKLRANPNPPFPEGSPSERPILSFGNGKVATDPNVSNAEDAQQRWGEGADWIVGPYVAWQDYKANYGDPFTFLDPYVAWDKAVRSRAKGAKAPRRVWN